MSFLSTLPCQCPHEDELSDVFLLESMSCKDDISVLRQHQQLRAVLVMAFSSANDTPNNDLRAYLRDFKEYNRCLNQILRTVSKEDDVESQAGLFLPKWTLWPMTGFTVEQTSPLPRQIGWNIREFVAWEQFHSQWNLAALHTMIAVGCQSLQPRRGSGHIDHGAAASHFSTAIEHVEQCRDFLGQPFSSSWSALRSVLSPELLVTWKLFLEAQVQRAAVSSLLIEKNVDHRLVVGAAYAGKVLMDRFLQHCSGSSGSQQKNNDSPLQTQRQPIWESSARAWSLVMEAIMYYHHSYVVETGHDSLGRAERALMTLFQQRNSNLSAEPSFLESLKSFLRNGLLKQIRLRKQDFGIVDGVDDEDGGWAMATTTKHLLPTVAPKYYVPSNSKGGYFTIDWSEIQRERSNTKALEPSPSAGTTKARTEAPPTPAEPSKGNSTATEVGVSNVKDSQHMDILRKQGMDLFNSFLTSAQQSSRNWMLVVVYNTLDQKRAFATMKTNSPFVGDMLKAGFVVWTAWNEDAVYYTEQHSVVSLPHVGIIEPFSGDLMWRLDGCDFHQSWFVERFADAALNFCGHSPFDGLAAADNIGAITSKTTDTGNPKANLMKTVTIPHCEPPTHLVYTAGGFRSALEEAGASRRWMLVNLQADNVLASHHLNRDVWRDSMVGGVVRENFVFWQKLCSADEGRVYARLFRVTNYPHVAIMNPFTGDIAWSQEGWSAEKPLTADSFMEAYINLIPTPEPRSSSKSPASIATSSAGASSEERSWELLSLLDNWDRLSVGGGDSESFMIVSGENKKAEDDSIIDDNRKPPADFSPPTEVNIPTDYEHEHEKHQA